MSLNEAYAMTAVVTLILGIISVVGFAIFGGYTRGAKVGLAVTSVLVVGFIVATVVFSLLSIWTGVKA